MIWFIEVSTYRLGNVVYLLKQRVRLINPAKTQFGVYNATESKRECELRLNGEYTALSGLHLEAVSFAYGVG